MTKVKIEVHTPFNLIRAEKPGDPKFEAVKRFDVGHHKVDQETADHPWVKAHTVVVSEDADEEEETEEVAEEEAEEETEEETSEEEETEETEDGETTDETPQGRGRGRRR